MWFELLLGHLVGDYILQNDAMAKSKSLKGWRGHFWCFLHCIIYAYTVSFFLWFGGFKNGPLAMTIAFLTHYPIDRYSLGKRWMDFYGQTTEGPFAPIIYVGVDNGAHLVLMWIAFRLLGA